MKGLILLPNVIADDPFAHIMQLPKSVFDAMKTIDGLFAENAREARRYAKNFELKMPLQSMPVIVIDKKAKIHELMQPVLAGETWGVVSDAGVPCIADPGSALVAYAHRHAIHVQALVGPNSIMLALMLSGMPAQAFSFQGYLPRKPDERKKAIRLLEKEARQKKSTQIFIETPYRNQHLLEALVETLDKETHLAVASNILSSKELVISKKVALWRKEPLANIAKVPTVFLFHAK